MYDHPYISNALSILTGGMAVHSEKSLLPIIAHWSNMVPSLKDLPLVDVGSNTGDDVTIPAAKLGHRVYAYEPTPNTVQTLFGHLRAANVNYTTRVEGFQFAQPGTVLVRPVAVSNFRGTRELTTSHLYGGVANTLGGTNALPTQYVEKGTRQVSVKTVRLGDELKREPRGVYLLKIDAQGHEWHVLRGVVEYALRRPIYFILLEFSPMLLGGAGIEPIQLLRLLTKGLDYQCFEGRNQPARLSMSLEKFVEAHPPNSTRRNKFGAWTDLLCVRLDLVRRLRK